MDPPTTCYGKGYQLGPKEISGHRKVILWMPFFYEESEREKKEIIGKIEEVHNKHLTLKIRRF